MYGDLHQFYFQHGDCDYISQMFIISSTVDANLADLEGNIIRILFNGRRTDTEFLGTFQASGYLNIAILLLGSYRIEDVIAGLPDDRRNAVGLTGSRLVRPKRVLRHHGAFLGCAGNRREVSCGSCYLRGAV